jgi:hypothetical protein
LDGAFRLAVDEKLPAGLKLDDPALRPKQQEYRVVSQSSAKASKRRRA